MTQTTPITTEQSQPMQAAVGSYVVITQPRIEVVVPVLNEAAILEASIRTLDQFKALIKEEKVKYYAVSSSGMNSTGEIETWVKKYGTTISYGGNGVTLHQLSV